MRDGDALGQYAQAKRIVAYVTYHSLYIAYRSFYSLYSL